MYAYLCINVVGNKYVNFKNKNYLICKRHSKKSLQQHTIQCWPVWNYLICSFSYPRSIYYCIFNIYELKWTIFTKQPTKMVSKNWFVALPTPKFKCGMFFFCCFSSMLPILLINCLKFMPKECKSYIFICQNPEGSFMRQRLNHLLA